MTTHARSGIDSTVGIAQTATRQDMFARASSFAQEWENETRERAEKDSFWNEFFTIFGIHRRRVGGIFEYSAKRHSTGNRGSMDLLWPGKIAVEHKSLGRSLSQAMDQLADYLLTIPESDLPYMAVVSDFKTFLFRILETGETKSFPLHELPDHIDRFAFLAGFETNESPKNEEEASLEATRLLADLHDELFAAGYPAHDLRVLLVRLLYILFADDTHVWEKNLFEDYIRVKTAEDGGDLGSKLRDVFDVLNTPPGRRMSNLDQTLADFEYVNGGLFAEHISPLSCNKATREKLLKACGFEWSRISPVIFGSLFQNVMDNKSRRKLGAHFTTERDIMRTLRPLFLDQLEEELEEALAAPTPTKRLNKLRPFRAKLGTLTFLDPAAGCGNFLILSYRELRRLELEAQLAIQKDEGGSGEVFDIDLLRQVQLSQFHGIEIEEFPARIAETAMHLVAHHANMQMSRAFGKYVIDLPLSKSAHIVVGDALTTDWDTVIPSSELTYLVGNPPFVGLSLRSPEQTAGLERVWGNGYHGSLDFVTAWYKKGVDYIDDNPTKMALVSTNSICQGEQVNALWSYVYDKNFTIDFAHRTFAWTSEARGAAHVHVVIIGLINRRHLPTQSRRRLYEYATPKSESTLKEVRSISPYLVEGDELPVIPRTTKPLALDVPEVSYGSKATDGGNLVVGANEYAEFDRDQTARKYLRKYIGAKELLHNTDRWCLWMAGSDFDPSDLKASGLLAERVQLVKEFRLASVAAVTREKAKRPHKFVQIGQPSTNYVCIPRHISEKHQYFPVRHEAAEVIVSDACFAADDPTGMLFAVISSKWFMVWQSVIGGRIKSDYRFNKYLAWNTFPLPELSRDKSKAIIDAGKAVLEARKKHPSKSLADLYNTAVMYDDLLEAHKRLDKTLDKALAPRKMVRNDEDRLEILFASYVHLINAERLVKATAPTTRRRTSRT